MAGASNSKVTGGKDGHDGAWLYAGLMSMLKSKLVVVTVSQEGISGKTAFMRSCGCALGFGLGPDPVPVREEAVSLLLLPVLVPSSGVGYEQSIFLCQQRRHEGWRRSHRLFALMHAAHYKGRDTVSS